MNEKELETIAQDFKGKTIRTGLCRGKEHVHFWYNGFFNEELGERIFANGKMTKEDYAKGIAELAKAGYCNIPLAGEKGYLEIKKAEDGLVINFKGSDQGNNIYGMCINWDIALLRLKN